MDKNIPPKFRVGDKIYTSEPKKEYTIRNIVWKEEGGYHGCWGYEVEEDPAYCLSEPIVTLVKPPVEGTCDVCTSQCKQDSPCAFMTHR